MTGVQTCALPIWAMNSGAPGLRVTPNIAATNNKFATPGPTSLILSPQVPLVNATNNVAITLNSSALTTTQMIPSVIIGLNDTIPLNTTAIVSTMYPISVQTERIHGTMNIYEADGWRQVPTKMWNGTEWVEKPISTWLGDRWL